MKNSKPPIRAYDNEATSALQRLYIKSRIKDPTFSLAEAYNLEGIEAIKLLIDKGLDLNRYSKSLQDTPMYAAIDKDRADIVKLLISQGAKVDILNYHKETPLYRVCNKYRELRNSYELAELLIENGANVNFKYLDNTTPLDIATMYGRDMHSYDNLVKLLLENGADVRCGVYGYESVKNYHYNEDPEMLEYLLKKGAPIDLGAGGGGSIIINDLVQRSEYIQATSALLNSPMTSEKVLKAVINHKNFKPNTRFRVKSNKISQDIESSFLEEAVEYKRVKVLVRLLDRPDIELPSKSVFQEKLLDLAIESMDTHLIKVLSKNKDFAISGPVDFLRGQFCQHFFAKDNKLLEVLKFISRLDKNKFSFSAEDPDTGGTFLDILDFYHTTLEDSRKIEELETVQSFIKKRINKETNELSKHEIDAGPQLQDPCPSAYYNTLKGLEKIKKFETRSSHEENELSKHEIEPPEQIINKTHIIDPYIAPDIIIGFVEDLITPVVGEDSNFSKPACE